MIKTSIRRGLACAAKAVLASALALGAGLSQAAPQDGAPYNDDTKYSPLKQITAANVDQLQMAWEYHTGETPPKDVKDALIAFEDQPSLIDGNLVVCTVTRRIIALDPATGKQRWIFDPQDPKVGMRKCRGISHWVDSRAAPGTPCKSRIFVGTADYRLIAIDGATGQRCPAFGDNGQVQMKPSMPEIFKGEVVSASKPAVVNDVVVVGSAVADNQRVKAPSGQVLAFDARTGKPVWSFDPLPRDPADPAYSSWAKGTDGYGGGNVWANMAVDEALDLVYLPTTSPSGDFFGGGRAGDNRYSSSVVALKGSTGKVVWSQQLVHHNIFDYDTPTEPLLIDLPVAGGGTVPALVQNNKTGLIFVFNRATGEPLVPMVEHPITNNDLAVPGEAPAKTQPIPQGMPTLAPQGFSPDDVWGFTFVDRWLCKHKAEQYNYGPIFTPPSLKGTIFSPSVGGGPNWGGGAYDPDSHLMVVPSNRVPTIVTLIPREQAQLKKSQSIESGGAMIFPNAGAPYVPKIEPLLSPLGSPCSAPPWAALTAVDLVNHKILWEVPLGDIKKMMPVSPPSSMDTKLGTPGAGGPLVTAGGLVFIGYTLDDTLRAFDLHSGKVLWSVDLPAAGVGVPVTYEVGGEQYIVIPAGGHSMYHSTMGDSVVAYKLKH